MLFKQAYTAGSSILHAESHFSTSSVPAPLDIQRQEKANNNLHTPYERNNLAVTPVWKRFTRLSQQQLFTGGGQEPAEAAFC